MLLLIKHCDIGSSGQFSEVEMEGKKRKIYFRFVILITELIINNVKKIILHGGQELNFNQVSI